MNCSTTGWLHRMSCCEHNKMPSLLVQQIQWQEHLGLCRSPTSYQTKKYVKTAKNCMDICDKDSRCLMVKYSKRARTCWLCDNKSLAPSVKCSLKHDFYIKGNSEHNVSKHTSKDKCMHSVVLHNDRIGHTI